MLTPKITPMEREIIALTAQGLSCKLIAIRLKCTHTTAESYRGRILRKFHLKTSPQMVAWAYQNGILTDVPEYDEHLQRRSQIPVI